MCPTNGSTRLSSVIYLPRYDDDTFLRPGAKLLVFTDVNLNLVSVFAAEFRLQQFALNFSPLSASFSKIRHPHPEGLLFRSDRNGQGGVDLWFQHPAAECRRTNVELELNLASR